MPEKSLAPQNPLDSEPINYQPTRTFYPITDDDRQVAQDTIRATIARTIKDLNPLGED
jgi:hypothetical protein